MVTPEDVLDFWLADTASSVEATAARGVFWFGASAELDEEIRQRFSGAISEAEAGACDLWAVSARGRLALIILLDQFPRNIFRGTREVFRYDAAALALAREGVERGQPAELSIPEQIFFLMPYQHSEELVVQREGLELMRRLVAEAPDEWRGQVSGHWDFARRHHDIVSTYGRFPHRNTLLGRSSTEAEVEFLEAGGETFGQGGES